MRKREANKGLRGMGERRIRIGGASGFWGESASATPQLLAAGGLDYIVYDYLAEITMSILARARAENPETGGFASDFISAVLKPNLREIARQGVKIVSNAGGVNPAACGAAARALIAEMGLSLKVAVVSGDDLMPRKSELANSGIVEMFSGAPFPDPAKLASVNAYLGAFPIAAALAAGADIVITGRCVDSAVTLGPCIHAFGWGPGDYDRLAQGSLAGHLIECGPQACGGNFTDWEEIAPTMAEIGYPIAEISEDGAVVITKPPRTGGKVSVGTVAEQMLYEIGDPQAYLLPDVACDFSGVRFAQIGDDRVSVSGAHGRAPPRTLKVCATYLDGFRGGQMLSFYGRDATARAKAFAGAAFSRARAALRARNLGEFSEESVEILGAESQYGAFAQAVSPREVVAKLAVKHPDPAGVSILLREAIGLGLSTPPGLSGFIGGRPQPSPVVRLFSFLLPKSEISPVIALDGAPIPFTPGPTAPEAPAPIAPPPPEPPRFEGSTTEVPVVTLAWARSGDKGDSSNIGIIARRAEYLPYLWAALSEQVVLERLTHFASGPVRKYYLPGCHALNFLIDNALGGGGVASLRNDPQGKGFAQLLLEIPVRIPSTLLEPT